MALYKCIILLSIIASVLGSGHDTDLKCSYDMPSVPINWIVIAPQCLNKVTELINIKLANSVQYLALGAYFSRDSVNRMGFSDMFYESADNDRDDALQLIDYILMRGAYINPDDIIQLFYSPPLTEWNKAQDAVADALKLEADTTKKFQDAITVCETNGINDYNIANWMAKYFIRNQYDDQKYFADLISSLKKMEKLHLELGEFLMDQELC